MPRQARVSAADIICHVINRANGRAKFFHTDKYYQHFESLLQEAKDLTDMRILACCVMPNHWHLVLYPKQDGGLQKFMSWLSNTHTRRWHVTRSGEAKKWWLTPFPQVV